MREDITATDDFEIRYSIMDDGSYLSKWLQDAKTRLWFPVSSDQDAQMFVRNWIGFARYQASLTALYKGEPVGVVTLFLMPYLKVAHTTMLYIVVDKEHRNKGVGTALLRNAIHLAKTRFRLESIHLEVFGGCDLMSLLQKANFYEVFWQKDFVKTEEGYIDRAIMEVDLTK